jgi:hypothetical protein
MIFHLAVDARMQRRAGLPEPADKVSMGVSSILVEPGNLSEVF